jgi:hypothetical protein
MNKYIVLYSISPVRGLVLPESAQLSPGGYSVTAVLDALDREELFRQMNQVDGTEFIARLKGTRSMTSGDVAVELTPEGVLTTWLCCSVGWARVQVPTQEG